MSNRSVINIDGDFSLRPPDVAPGTLVHSLPYKRSIVGSLFLGGFLAAFISPFFFVGSIMGGPDGGLFALVTVMFSVFWMLGWSVAVSLIALLFLGSMFGRECLFITPGQLVVRMELFGAGFARTFRGDEIKDLLKGKSPIRDYDDDAGGTRAAASAVPSTGKAKKAKSKKGDAPDTGGLEPQPS